MIFFASNVVISFVLIFLCKYIIYFNITQIFSNLFYKKAL
nr:MAG TPA: hypothetical protein [Caudoviricetes sp.]